MRPTKNVDSLVKYLNNLGCSVHIDQTYFRGMFTWDAAIFGGARNNLIGICHIFNHGTPQSAIREAMTNAGIEIESEVK